MDREIPKTGDVYRHFKGQLYKVICVGHHSETGEKMVVYYNIGNPNPDILSRTFEWLYNHEPCIRPLAMFMSEVDQAKYPEVKQKYRFEKVLYANL